VCPFKVETFLTLGMLHNLVAPVRELEKKKSH